MPAKKKKTPLQRLDGVKHQRLDGWENDTTGLGTLRDKSTLAVYLARPVLSDAELSALFYGSAIAARIVAAKPNAMFRKGYALENKKLEAARKALKVDTHVRLALIWARLFGGSLIIIGADDGGDMSRALGEFGKVRDLKYLKVIDRRWAKPVQWYSDPRHPKFGEVEMYSITPANAGASMRLVHESRVIRIDGTEVDDYERFQLNGWSYSVLQAVYDDLRQFSQAYQSTSHLMSDASQAVFKIQGLMEQIAANADLLQTRMALVDQSRSVVRAILLDADGESFERSSTSFAGLPDLLDRYQQLLSAVTGIPVAVLMGRAPAGLNATGESDTRIWYDEIKIDQVNEAQPLLERIYSLIAPGEAGIKWNPLMEETAKECAEVKQIQANTDKLYFDMQALLPQEIALKRFGPESDEPLSPEGLEAREESLKDDLETLAEGDDMGQQGETPGLAEGGAPAASGGNGVRAGDPETDPGSSEDVPRLPDPEARGSSEED